MRRREAARILAEACEDLLESLAWRKRERSRAPLIAQLDRDVAAVFRAQGKAFLAEWEKAKPLLQEAVRAGDWGPWWLRVATKTKAAFIKAIDKAAKAAVRIGWKDTAAQAPGVLVADPIGKREPGVVGFLRDRAAAQVTKINDTTRQRLNEIITSGVEQGLSHGAIAAQIRDEFNAFAVGKPQQHIDSRAHLVAITEIGEAYEESTLQASQALAAAGLPQEKSWLTVGDKRVSKGCQANEAAGWIDLAGAFPSGHGRPLRFPGCRCTLLTRRKKG